MAAPYRRQGHAHAGRRACLHRERTNGELFTPRLRPGSGRAQGRHNADRHLRLDQARPADGCRYRLRIPAAIPWRWLRVRVGCRRHARRAGIVGTEAHRGDRVSPHNHDSIRVLEKLGLRFEKMVCMNADGPQTRLFGRIRRRTVFRSARSRASPAHSSPLPEWRHAAATRHPFEPPRRRARRDTPAIPPSPHRSMRAVAPAA